MAFYAPKTVKSVAKSCHIGFVIKDQQNVAFHAEPGSHQ